MQLPPYYLSRPQAEAAPGLHESFDRLFDEHIREGGGTLLNYSLSAPKWQFLCYLGDKKQVLFHGSGEPDIAEFEPRQSNDTEDFGNQRAVYASSDPLWSGYFAIVDRPRYVRSLVNSCICVKESDSEPQHYYYFSVNGDALPHRPWRTGTVYILPGQGFEQQQASPINGVKVESAQWRSFKPVRPLAKISVTPADFPFLAEIRGHDPSVVNQRAQVNPDGFPWLDGQSGE